MNKDKWSLFHESYLKERAEELAIISKISEKTDQDYINGKIDGKTFLSIRGDLKKRIIDNMDLPPDAIIVL